MVWQFWHAFLAAAIAFAASNAIAAPSSEIHGDDIVADTLVQITQSTGTRARTARDRATVQTRATRKPAPRTRRSSSRNRRLVAKVNAPPPPSKPAELVDGPAISLAASLVEGGNAVTSGVVWTLEPLDATGEPIVSNVAAPTMALPAGKYRITAKLDDFLKSAEVDIPEKGIVRLNLSFNAARLKVSVLPTEFAMPLQDARIRILSIGVDGAPVVIDTKSPAFDEVLPAGIYRVEASHGLARVSEDIGLAAGANRDVELNLNVGYVRVRARPAPDAEPLANVVFELLPADGLEIAPQPLATMSGERAIFTLPAGPYRIVARYGEASVRQQVEVRPNSFGDVIMDLDAGRLVARLDGQGKGVAREAAFRLASRDDENGGGLLLSRRGETLDLGLPAGSYSLTVDWNGETTGRDFVLESGARKELTLSFSPARLDLAASAGGLDLAPDAISWTVQNAETGDKLLEGEAPGDAPLEVAAGEYLIAALHRPTGARADVALELAPGADAVGEVSLPIGVAEFTLRQGAGESGAWVVSRPDGTEMLRHEGTGTKVPLQAGDYVVSLSLGETTHSAALNVTEGGTTMVILPE